MIKCPKCKTPVVSEPLTCRHCGEELEAGWDECPYCGKPIAKEASTEKPAIPLQQQSEPADSPSLTDEMAKHFYNCLRCQDLAPSHVCIITPEVPGECGKVSWLEAERANAGNPDDSCKTVLKKKVIDENLGIWEGVNEAIQQDSYGAIQQVALYSLFQDPMTSGYRFECVCGTEVSSNGVCIVNREYTGKTPVDMSFSELASSTGGGVQTPGFRGHAKQYISSKKFIKGDGGHCRIVWMPKALKEQVGRDLDRTVKALYGISNFTSMIADETVCEEDLDELLSFLQAKQHPVLNLPPLL